MKNIIITLLLGLMLCSCGARKAESSKTKEAVEAEFSDQSKSEQTEQSQTKGEINVKKSEEVTVDNQNQIVTKKETIEPVDSTKPASYTDNEGKKQELNNSKKTTETRTEINNSKTESKAKTEASGKTERQSDKRKAEHKNIKAKSVAEKQAKAKVVNRQAWNYWNLLWILVPIALLIIAIRNRLKISNWIKNIWWV